MSTNFVARDTPTISPIRHSRDSLSMLFTPVLLLSVSYSRKYFLQRFRGLRWLSRQQPYVFFSHRLQSLKIYFSSRSHLMKLLRVSAKSISEFPCTRQFMLKSLGWWVSVTRVPFIVTKHDPCASDGRSLEGTCHVILWALSISHALSDDIQQWYDQARG